jgi:hypothetical protein
MRSTEKQPDIIREYFLEANPNPERIGCPPEAKLKLAAENHLPVNDPARLHLASCSECFAEYRGYRLDWQTEQRRRMVIGWAVAAGLLITLGGGALLLHERHPHAGSREEIAQTAPPQIPARKSDVVSGPERKPPVAPTPPKADEPGHLGGKQQPTHGDGGTHSAHEQAPHGSDHSQPPHPPAPMTPAPNQTVRLSLDGRKTVDEEPARGREEPVTLQAATLDLTLTLSEASIGGRYEVLVSRDADGNEVLARGAGMAEQASDKPVIQVRLALEGLLLGDYYLLLKRMDSPQQKVYRLKVVTKTEP